MWEQMNGFERCVLIVGTSYILGVIAVLIVMLTFDLPLVVFYLSLMLCVVLGLGGPFLLRMWERVCEKHG